MPVDDDSGLESHLWWFQRLKADTPVKCRGGSWDDLYINADVRGQGVVEALYRGLNRLGRVYRKY